MLYQEGGDNIIKGHINVDWADDIRDWKFMSNFLFHLGDGPIKWSFGCKQWIVVVSSIEVKYNALIEETKKRYFVEWVIVLWSKWVVSCYYVIIKVAWKLFVT